ncbi:TadE/TadG family type IV pilus assembly protein [Novosphingobium aerophilum]|uniref:TadE/TadG family type IV pilus assembly protein n=1 Tax=Novosphingobium TaxID=165696 RepID=UPI000A9F8C36|nr:MULTISPECIES: TadE family protein [unclassified Novosphingobium]TCM37131.1 TadE-like protein [Novosphingobium sp. ST904]WRT94396.1 TadE family protein [Novosphingobium sp. RL4]
MKRSGHHRPVRRFAALLRRCGAAREGVTAVEFALAAPVLIMLLMGIFDIGHMAYVRAVLQGAVQQVARNATLETADTATEDAFVSKIVGGVAPGAVVEFSRSSYYDFTDIARPESWNDKNNNGICDNGETYTDENKNGQWDADVGKSGNGGANDVVIYKVNVTYSPLFPIPGLTNRDATRTLSATAVKKNQPYSLQQAYGSAAGTCR